MLGQIHKKQTPIVPVRKVPPPDKPADKASPDQAAQDKPKLPDAAASQSTPSAAPKLLPDAIVPQPHNALPLKIFFLLAIGLFVSTLSGLYMSYKYIRNRKLITAHFSPASSCRFC
jgi:hypothetical protein